MPTAMFSFLDKYILDNNYRLIAIGKQHGYLLSHFRVLLNGGCRVCMCSSWSHEALRDFYFFELGKRIVIVIAFRSRNIVWVSHLLLLSDLTSESSIPHYCSVLFTTVICGWEEFILIYFSFVIPRLALLCEPLILVRYGNCCNLSLFLGPVTLFWVVWVIYCF